MMPTGRSEKSYFEIILYTILFLFFFQLVANFIESIYAFGLLSTGVTIEILSVIFLFSPVVLWILPKGISGWGLVLLGEAVLLSRVVEVSLDTRGEMIISGVGVGCFLIFFPALLRSQRRGGAERSSLSLGISLTFGLALSILLRALNSGSDLSEAGGYQAIGWVLALAAALLLLRLREAHGTDSPQASASESSPEAPGRGKIAGLSIGIIGVWTLLYFAFTSPNVIARWTGASFQWILAVLLLTLVVFVILLSSRQGLLSFLTPAAVWIWNGLFVIALVLTIGLQQVAFPAAQSAYPLPEPAVTPFAVAPLIFLLLLSPVILVDFILFTRQLILEKPPSRSLGRSFTLAALVFLVLVLAQVFTTVYDYIPVAGPFFRDRFWLVFLLAGLALALPILGVRKETFTFDLALGDLGVRGAAPGGMLVISVIALAGAGLAAAKPAPTPTQPTTLRVLTYNIQQGYSAAGQKNFDGQLDVIRRADPDIIGLEECDTARIAGGNADVVRYFADRLNLYSYYGPKTVTGTFGIALLSKYPIQNPQTFFMYSRGEQTAAIQAQISLGGKTFNVFVTHLGNGGPIFQQEELLQRLQGLESVILMGDFNFRPDSEQYRLTTQTLQDSWLLKWPQGLQPGASSADLDPMDRIDHIFVSPGTNVADSEYLLGPQSDHPAMTTLVEW